MDEYNNYKGSYRDIQRADIIFVEVANISSDYRFFKVVRNRSGSRDKKVTLKELDKYIRGYRDYLIIDIEGYRIDKFDNVGYLSEDIPY